MLAVLRPTKLTDFYGFLPFSQSSNFNRITILRNGVFSPLFSKYVLFVWNKLCSPIKWLIFRRVWGLLILLIVLELISQSSNFARITILRNGVFSPIFSKYVLLDRNKLYPPINWWIQFFSDKNNIFAKYRGKKRLKNAISQNSNSGKITTLRNEF